MDKETEAKRDNKEHVYFKVLLKNITYTTKFLFKICVHAHTYIFIQIQVAVKVIQSIPSSR